MSTQPEPAPDLIAQLSDEHGLTPEAQAAIREHIATAPPLSEDAKSRIRRIFRAT